MHWQTRRAEERRSLCVELFEQGLTARQIAPIVGIDERNVRSHLRRSGVVGPLSRARDEGVDPRPLRAVRLTDVPIEARLEAADTLILSGAVNGAEAREVLLAAAWPSDQEYWVPASS